MKQTKICIKCGKEFITYRNGRYCGYICYWSARWGQNKKCKTCEKKLKKNQFRYCSNQCLKNFWYRNAYQLIKKNRIWDKKEALIRKLGGKCKICGLKDIRVLDINHIDRNQKKIPPKRQYTWQRRFKEWNENLDNLELLCANCHRIHTWEQMGYGRKYINKIKK